MIETDFKMPYLIYGNMDLEIMKTKYMRLQRLKSSNGLSVRFVNKNA